VNITSFNARGVKFEDTGNYAPRFTHHGGTAPSKYLSSSKVFRPELSIRQRTLPKRREDRIDVSLPISEQKQQTKRDKEPATTLPQPQLQTMGRFLCPPMDIGLHLYLLPHIPQPFNAANNCSGLPTLTYLPHHNPATPNPSRHRPDTNSKSLEHHLDSALAILIQTSGILADDVTPQARNTLKAINALASSMKTPTYDPLPFEPVRKVAKWCYTNRVSIFSYLILSLVLSLFFSARSTFMMLAKSNWQ